MGKCERAWLLPRPALCVPTLAAHPSGWDSSVPKQVWPLSKTVLSSDWDSGALAFRVARQIGTTKGKLTSCTRTASVSLASSVPIRKLLEAFRFHIDLRRVQVIGRFSQAADLDGDGGCGEL